jgi:V/A-type H+-transporting ATPase subunit I
MAVCKVKKLELVAHTQHRGEILRVLRRLGSVHISDVRELLSGPESENEAPAFLEKAIEQMESRLSRKQYCLEFLERYIPKPSFTESLLKGKPVFTARELEDCLATFATDGFYDQCKEFEKEISDNESRIEKNETLIEDVAYWRNMDSPFESISDTATTRVKLGISDARTYDQMIAEIDEASSLFYEQVVDRSNASVSTLMAYHKSVEETVAPILRQHGWREVRFPDLRETPAEVQSRLRDENAELRERNLRLQEQIQKELAPSYEKLLLLIDHYTQELEALKIQHSFLFTSSAFLLTGWMIARQEEELKNQVAEVTNAVEIKCSDAGPEDEVPILLDNGRFAQPFGLVTELYGRPQYTEFDPTPLLAPFFAVFFGICLGDGGYGLILTVGSLLALKKLPLQGGARRLVQILLISGIATTIFGFLTGGIFGIEAARLPSPLKQLVIFNPTTEITTFLYLAFAIGIFQMIFGIGTKVTHSMQEGDIAGALLEQGIWILFILSAAPLGFKYLFGGEVGPAVISIGLGGTVLFSIIIVRFGARRQIDFKVKRLSERIGLNLREDIQDKVDYLLSGALFLLGRLGLGIVFFLKNVIGYFGDVLSYSRLMALGLATAFLGMVINQIAGLALGIPYGIGLVMFVLILVFGHTFNLVVNCLSAFVHTLRLQYLEFFSKFFVGGGEPFTPFAEERKYTSIQLG